MANKIQITGNVVFPFELKFTESGVARLSGRIADTPRRYNKQTNEWEDAGDTLFMDVTMWGDDAEHLADTISEQKGRVTVTGTAGTRTYTTKDGEERTSFTVRADTIFLHAPKNRSHQSSGWDSQPQQQQPAQQDVWGNNTGQGAPF